MKKAAFILTIYFVSFCRVFAQTQETQNALALLNQGFIKSSFETLKKQATTKNDSWAQFFLAQCYEFGFGTQVDKNAAFYMYRRAAERGLAISQIALSNCYQNGIGIQRSSEKAKYWLAKAHGKYNPEDLTFLNTLYQEGIKHPENYELNPNYNSLNNNAMLAQNNEMNNSNNTIGSNNQTINNITIVQGAPNQQPIPVISQPEPQPKVMKSDVDENIPNNSNPDELTFVVIIANENYQEVANVPNAINDGEVFAEYCTKCLGVPGQNVHFVKNATLNNIKREINFLKQVTEIYLGDASVIFYYAGHGIPDEVTKNAYLLPVDGYGIDVSTGYSLTELYRELGELSSRKVIVLLDACFSGTQRGEGMLASARGVAIKTKQNSPLGKMVVLSAAQGDETAYPYEEQGHGLFTYYLLKSLKESNGSVSLGELSAYIKDNVSKKSIVINGKSQTPSVSASSVLGESWRNWTLK